MAEERGKRRTADQTRIRKKVFLELYASHPIMSDCAKQLGFKPQTAYSWCHEDPEFKAEIERLDENTIHMLRDAAKKRAVKKSDRLIELLLKRYDKKYAAQNEGKTNELNIMFQNDPRIKVVEPDSSKPTPPSE